MQKQIIIATAFSGGLAALEFALKYENIKHAVKDELGDSYCACDVSLFCGECISTNENCEKCVDFFSYDDMENLSSNGGGLLSE